MKYGVKLKILFFIPLLRISANHLIEPNPFYIQQATFVLTDIHDTGIMQEIENCFKLVPKQSMTDLNQFVTLKKKSQPIKSRSKSRSPVRLASLLAGRSKSQAKKSPERVVSSGPDSSQYVVDGRNSNPSNNIYHYHKEQRHMSPLSVGTHGLKAKTETSLEQNCFFSDISLHQSLIYYAQSDSSEDGILFPTARRLDSLFVRIFTNFVQSCFKIKNLFEGLFSNVRNNDKE